MSSKKNKKPKKLAKTKTNEPDKGLPEKENVENSTDKTAAETEITDKTEKPQKISLKLRKRKKGFTLIQKISMRLGILSQNRSVVLQLSLERILSCFFALAALDFSCVFCTLGSLVYTKQCEVNGTLKNFGRSVFSFSADHGLRGIIDSFTLTVFDRMGNPYDKKEKCPFQYKRDHYIVGHIFTQRLNHLDDLGRGKIFISEKYRGCYVIDLDCGMAINSRSSRLGCLELETMREYYVALMEL